MDASGSFKICSRYFAIGAKNKNLAGRSGIEVLVVGFSQIGALKKHTLLVLNSNTDELCLSFQCQLKKREKKKKRKTWNTFL